MTYGSLINVIADGAQAVDPVVGMPATMLSWTDRQAATVIAIERNGQRIIAQADLAIRTDENGMSDAQAYRYERDPNGSTRTYTRRADGSYRERGGTLRLVLGQRSHYYDYSF